LLDISSSFQQWKNFENRLRFDKVIAKSLVASFFLEHSVVFRHYKVYADIRRGSSGKERQIQ